MTECTLRQELFRQADISLQHARDRTSRLCFLGDFIELCSVNPGNLSLQIEVNGGNCPISVNLFQRERCFCGQFVRLESFGTQKGRYRHGKAASVSRGD